MNDKQEHKTEINAAYGLAKAEQLLNNSHYGLPKFLCTPDNNYGMLGSFTGFQDGEEFYTDFTTWDKGVTVRICQHENLEQAQEMAEELNRYSQNM